MGAQRRDGWGVLAGVPSVPSWNTPQPSHLGDTFSGKGFLKGRRGRWRKLGIPQAFLLQLLHLARGAFAQARVTQELPHRRVVGLVGIAEFGIGVAVAF